MSTNDSVVIVTGAAGALGRAVVQRFLAAGARLALFDRDAAVLKQMFPAAAFTEAVDITDEADWQSAWFTPGGSILVSDLRQLEVDGVMVPGEYLWAR